MSDFAQLVGLGKVIEWLGRLAGPFALVSAICVWVFGIVTDVILTALELIVSKLNSASLDGLGQASFATAEWVGYANAIFPLNEFCIMAGIYFTFAAIVISVRWIKSFIPTIGN